MARGLKQHMSKREAWNTAENSNGRLLRSWQRAEEQTSSECLLACGTGVASLRITISKAWWFTPLILALDRQTHVNL